MERHMWHNIVFFHINTWCTYEHRVIPAHLGHGQCPVSAVISSDDADGVPTASGNIAPSAAVQPPDLCEVCLVEEYSKTKH